MGHCKTGKDQLNYKPVSPKVAVTPVFSHRQTVLCCIRTTFLLNMIWAISLSYLKSTRARRVSIVLYIILITGRSVGWGRRGGGSALVFAALSPTLS